MRPIDAVTVLLCLALGATLWRLAPRMGGANSITRACALVLPATIFADTMRFTEHPAAITLLACEILTAGLLFVSAHIYHGWVEVMCETWLLAGSISLIVAFGVMSVADVPDSAAANVDLIGVSLALFLAVSVERSAAAYLHPGRARQAISGFVWLRVACWILAFCVTAGIAPQLRTVAKVVETGAYLCAIALLVSEFVRPSIVVRARPRSSSPTFAFVLAGVVLAVNIAAYAFVPGFSRWSVLVLDAGCAAALLCREVITNRRLSATTRAAQEQERYFRSLVQESTDVIVICDADGALAYVSPAAANVIDADPDDLAVGGRAARLVGVPPGDLVDAFAECARSGRAVLEGRHGEQVLEAVCSRRDDGFVLSVRDVTERDRMRASLHSLAYNDTLTGLANRQRIIQDVEVLLRSGARDVQMLFIDLDGFKRVNDADGHRAGDAVLAQAAARLRECVDPGALLARLGGDEFTVVVQSRPDHAEALAVRMHRSLTRPFAVAGQVYQLGASIGVVGTQPGVDAEGMLQRADLAMFEAKQSHRPWVRYTPSMTASARAQVASDHGLAQEWGRDAAAVYLQPIVAPATLAVHSTEALLRWRRADGAIDSPAAALGFAERTGQLATLTGWVVEQVLAQVTATPDTTTPIAVNMPPTVLLEADFAAGLAARVASLGIPPTRINLELTEDAVVEQGASGLRALNALHDEGFHIHIDDFGTGFSSLSYLIRLPVDGLKIDRSFTRELVTSPAARSVVLGLVRFTREVGIDLIAEGVEREDEHHMLIDLGVPYAQGFWYGRPEPASSVADRSRLTSWSSGRPALPDAGALVLPPGARRRG